MFFANDMTDEQWAEVWQQFVPESAVLWNARLSGYPAGVPMTFVSMTDDVGVPPELAQQMIVNLGRAGRSQGVIRRPPGDGDKAEGIS